VAEGDESLITLRTQRRCVSLILSVSSALLFIEPCAGQTTRPVSSIQGNTGLWKVLSADTIPSRQASFAISYERSHFNPGELVTGTITVSAAVGLTSRLEGAIAVEANRYVRVRLPEQLSFGQQALGLFGQKIPGSPPLPSELMPGSSRVPQLRSPPTADGKLTGQAGYYNLLPFAGLVEAGDAAGYVTIGTKYKVLTQSRSTPLSLAAHSYFSVPIHKAIDYLMTHPVGTADLHFGVDVIASRNIAETADIYWNAGFRHISQPAHASVFRLSDELPLGIGFSIPSSGRIHFVVESVAQVFVGSHTPARTFGPADPVEVAAGVRMNLTDPVHFSIAYERPAQGGRNNNGFILSLSFNTRSSVHP
jgi:hypothetical protein